MEDSTINMLAYLGFFLVGMGMNFYVMRGFLIPYLKSKKGGYLLRIHYPDGNKADFVHGTLKEDGLLHYKVLGNDRIASIKSGVVVRSVRTNWIDIPFNSTAPFDYTNVTTVNEEQTVKVPSVDSFGELLVDKQTGKQLFENKTVKVPVINYFNGWDDTMLITNALMLASAKPKIPLNLASMGLDKKKIILIVGFIVVVGYFLFKNFAGGGTPTI